MFNSSYKQYWNTTFAQNQQNYSQTIISKIASFVMLCAIWYNLYDLKNVKSTHAEVILLIKFQASTYNFKVSLLHGCFKLHKW